MMMITILELLIPTTPCTSRGEAQKSGGEASEHGQKRDQGPPDEDGDLALLKNMTRDTDFTQYCWEPEVFKPTLFPLTRQCRKGAVIEGDRSL